MILLLLSAFTSAATSKYCIGASSASCTDSTANYDNLNGFFQAVTTFTSPIELQFTDSIEFTENDFEGFGTSSIEITISASSESILSGKLIIPSQCTINFPEAILSKNFDQGINFIFVQDVGKGAMNSKVIMVDQNTQYDIKITLRIDCSIATIENGFFKNLEIFSGSLITSTDYYIEDLVKCTKHNIGYDNARYIQSSTTGHNYYLIYDHAYESKKLKVSLSAGLLGHICLYKTSDTNNPCTSGAYDKSFLPELLVVGAFVEENKRQSFFECEVRSDLDYQSKKPVIPEGFNIEFKGKTNTGSSFHSISGKFEIDDLTKIQFSDIDTTSVTIDITIDLRSTESQATRIFCKESVYSLTSSNKFYQIGIKFTNIVFKPSISILICETPTTAQIYDDFLIDQVSITNEGYTLSENVQYSSKINTITFTFSYNICFYEKTINRCPDSSTAVSYNKLKDKIKEFGGSSSNDGKNIFFIFSESVQLEFKLDRNELIYRPNFYIMAPPSLGNNDEIEISGSLNLINGPYIAFSDSKFNLDTLWLTVKLEDSQFYCESQPPTFISIEIDESLSIESRKTYTPVEYRLYDSRYPCIVDIDKTFKQLSNKIIYTFQSSLLENDISVKVELKGETICYYKNDISNCYSYQLPNDTTWFWNDNYKSPSYLLNSFQIYLGDDIDIINLGLSKTYHIYSDRYSIKALIISAKVDLIVEKSVALSNNIIVTVSNDNIPQILFKEQPSFQKVSVVSQIDQDLQNNLYQFFVTDVGSFDINKFKLIGDSHDVRTDRYTYNSYKTSIELANNEINYVIKSENLPLYDAYVLSNKKSLKGINNVDSSLKFNSIDQAVLANTDKKVLRVLCEVNSVINADNVKNHDLNVIVSDQSITVTLKIISPDFSKSFKNLTIENYNDVNFIIDSSLTSDQIFNSFYINVRNCDISHSSTKDFIKARVSSGELALAYPTSNTIYIDNNGINQDGFKQSKNLIYYVSNGELSVTDYYAEGSNITIDGTNIKNQGTSYSIALKSSANQNAQTHLIFNNYNIFEASSSNQDYSRFQIEINNCSYVKIPSYRSVIFLKSIYAKDRHRLSIYGNIEIEILSYSADLFIENNVIVSNVIARNDGNALDIEPPNLLESMQVDKSIEVHKTLVYGGADIGEDVEVKIFKTSQTKSQINLAEYQYFFLPEQITVYTNAAPSNDEEATLITNFVGYDDHCELIASMTRFVGGSYVAYCNQDGTKLLYRTQTEAAEKKSLSPGAIAGISIGVIIVIVLIVVAVFVFLKRKKNQELSAPTSADDAEEDETRDSYAADNTVTNPGLAQDNEIDPAELDNSSSGNELLDIEDGNENKDQAQKSEDNAEDAEDPQAHEAEAGNE